MWEWIWLSQLRDVKYGNNGFPKCVFCSCFEKQPMCLETTERSKAVDNDSRTLHLLYQS